MLVEECGELDAKIAWKLAETNNQLESLGDLNEHITLLRQASKHSKTAENYDAQAQKIEDNTIHLLTVARQVLVFNEDNQSPVINTMLQSAKELREKAEKEVGKVTNYTNESNISLVCLINFYVFFSDVVSACSVTGHPIRYFTAKGIWRGQHIH